MQHNAHLSSLDKAEEDVGLNCPLMSFVQDDDLLKSKPSSPINILSSSNMTVNILRCYS